MSKFTLIEPSGSLCLCKYSRSITGTIQNQRYRQTRGNAANGSLIRGTTDQSCKRIFKTTECLCCR